MIQYYKKMKVNREKQTGHTCENTCSQVHIQHTQNHYICQQRPDWGRKKIQQYRKRSTRHTNGLEKFHHYCFAREVSIITAHQPLTTIFKMDVTLSQRLWQILLRKHQYKVRIIYKPGPDLFIADWLSKKNHNEDKDAEIPGSAVKY